MGEPDFECAKQYALERLEHELPPHAYYHSVQHTRDDVLPAARRFADLEGVTGHDWLCLLTAACFHDVGHIRQRIDHETVSAAIAADVLPQFGYDDEQIALVQRLILTTRWPPHPQTLLEKIIADADMDSLGRDDFLQTSLNLREELAGYGVDMTEEQWYATQLEFLESHRYFTNAAQRLRGDQKQRNIALVKRLLAEARRSEP